MNPRTCIVSRTQNSPLQMIRFVLGPEGVVYPDLKRKLPGRGVWVTASRKMVEQAISRCAFARGFKNQVRVDKNLADLIESLLRDDALQALMMAKKSGLATIGQAKAEALVKAGRASIVLQALDAGQDGAGKMAAAIRSQVSKSGDEIRLIDAFSSDELDAAFNKVNTVFVALEKGGATQKLAEAVDRLVKYTDVESD